MLAISADRWSLFDCLQVTKEEEEGGRVEEVSTAGLLATHLGFLLTLLFLGYFAGVRGEYAGIRGDHAGLPGDHAGVPVDHAGLLKPHKAFLLMVSCVHLYQATAGSLVLL